MEENSILFRITSDLRIRTSQIRLPLEYNRDFPDLGLRVSLYGEDSAFKEGFPALNPEDPVKKIWLLRDTFRCHYFMGPDPDQKRIWLIGPYLTEDMTFSGISRVCQAAGIDPRDNRRLHDYYHVIPCIRDENLLYALLHNHCVDVYGTDGFEISYFKMDFFSQAPAVHLSGPQTGQHKDMVSEIYLREKQMMMSISQGNYPGAISALKKLETQVFEARTSSTLRDMKNFCIVFNTICRIAAEQGGARVWQIDRESREFSIRIENSNEIRDLRVITEEMLKEYCDLVREGSNTFSPVVNRIIAMIRENLDKPLTLGEVAEKLNHNPNYLSIRFKKETGKSFTDYLTECRLSLAKQLLEKTDLPVASVAMECGIPDNNYFARLFRQKEGTSPSAWRQGHHQ